MNVTVDMKDINVTVFLPDRMILVSENRLRELLKLELELKASREVVEAAKQYIDEINDPDSNENYKNLRKKLDEARQG